jgi:hypothetical protein
MANDKVMELVTTVEDLAKAIAAAKADGVLSIFDLPKFLPVLKDSIIIVKDGPAMAEQFSTMTAEDWGTVGAAMIQALVDIIGAVTAPVKA